MQPSLKEFEDKGFRFFVVTLGTKGDLAFLDDLGVRNVLLDPKGEAFGAFKVSAIPETFVLDRQGVIYKESVGWLGEPSLRELRDAVDKLTAP